MVKMANYPDKFGQKIKNLLSVFYTFGKVKTIIKFKLKYFT